MKQNCGELFRLLSLLLALCCFIDRHEAFQPTRRRTRRIRFASFPTTPTKTLLQAEKNNGNPNNFKKKPSRFSQTVHKQQQHQQQQQNQNNNSPPTAPDAKSFHPKAPPPPAPFNKDRMWSSNRKSIEELEAKLTSRWGTNDLSRWTADDVQDDDDDDDDFEYATETKGPPTSSIGSLLRAKPVKDPWALDELDQDVSSSAFAMKYSSTQSSSSSRISQQSLKKVSPLSAFAVSRTSTTTNSDSTNNPTAPTTGSKQPKMNLSHLIADKPAGGRGTNQNMATTTTAPSPRVRSSDEASSTTQIKPATVVKSKREAAVPVTDANGNSIYLTTRQAEALFEASLLADKVDAAAAVVDGDSDPVEEEETSWGDLGVTHPLLLKNLEKMGCSMPLAVQRNSCAAILNPDQDVVVGTYTGSGKTLAFLVPLLQRLLADGAGKENYLQPTSVLIVAPGRELASQIASVVRDLIQDIEGLSVALAIGGTTFSRNLEQIRKRKPVILVGTPGRLAELIVGGAEEKRGRLAVKNLHSVVLDEFDALLEYKPHRDPTHAIIETLQRGGRRDRLQLVLCSATATDLLHKKPSKTAPDKKPLDQYLRPNYIVTLADKNDVLVTAGKDSKRMTRVSRTVLHGVVHCAHRRFALDMLRRILHTDPLPQQILIFVADSRRVKIVCEKLGDMGIVAAPLHGGMGSEKSDRAEVSKALREGYIGIVVATELAARGLDAPLLTHVINMDLPTDASHYAHRAGRCGRGGRPGVVINLTCSPQERNVPQKFAEQLDITMHTVDVKASKLNIVDPESLDID